MINTRYPSLSNQAKQIGHYSGYYSINPFLLAEITLNNKGDVIANAKELSLIANSSSFNKLTALSKSNLLNRSSSIKIVEKVKVKMNEYNIAHSNKRASNDNFPAMDFPFNHDESWVFNGIHTWTGNNNDSPMSSIDMTKIWGQSWGHDTSSYWVSAAHDGIITVFSSCFIRITHESGWATDYYHLDNVLFNTGDEVQAGEFISNYADNLAQAICQGGHSDSPHVHFALVRDGERYSLSGKLFSKWMMHPGTSSYDRSPSRMWLIKDGTKKFAFRDTINHLSGDNEIDYRYSGLYTSADINGHGVEVIISKIINGSNTRNVVFTTFYTYDDNGNANFYAGNIDFDNWRTDEMKTIGMIQTSGGNFSNLASIDSTTGVIQAGTLELFFIDCSTLDVRFNLLEPVSNQYVENELLGLFKIIGTPDYVCKAPNVTPEQ